VQLNLSLPQIKVLTILAPAGALTVGQIGEWVHVGQSAASHMVDRLVQAGLVERGEDPTPTDTVPSCHFPLVATPTITHTKMPVVGQ
jgi:predicted transcriptional regulator